MNETFEARLTQEERQLLNSLDSPAKIQAFLDRIPYSTENADRCPLSVLRDGKAHCLDGGLFAAAALRRIGYPPILLDILPEPGTDDDHVLALYKIDGHYGAVAKSNYTGLRFREAVYRNLRELVMSYFEDFFSLYRERSLRYYSQPLRLESLDHLGWMWSDEGATEVERRLWKQRKYHLVTPQMAARLSPVDALSEQAGMIGTNLAGVFVPKKNLTDQ
jgi:hypothetical protein